MYREEIAAISNGAEVKVRLKENFMDILLCHYWRNIHRASSVDYITLGGQPCGRAVC